MFDRFPRVIYGLTTRHRVRVSVMSPRDKFARQSLKYFLWSRHDFVTAVYGVTMYFFLISSDRSIDRYHEFTTRNHRVVSIGRTRENHFLLPIFLFPADRRTARSNIMSIVLYVLCNGYAIGSVGTSPTCLISETRRSRNYGVFNVSLLNPNIVLIL